MKTMELFSGTKSFSKVMAAHGYETFTVDSSMQFSPDLCCDILKIETSKLPLQVDLLWMSPPCTTFSVASIGHYWVEGKPKNDKCRLGIEIMEKGISMIGELNPEWWFLENPRGMMRKVIDSSFDKFGVAGYVRRTVSYCQYGHTIQKPTDIWTNATWWKPRAICKPGAPCHERAGRGSKSGVQGIYSPTWEKARGSSAMERGKIPPALFEEILEQLQAYKASL